MTDTKSLLKAIIEEGTECLKDAPIGNESHSDRAHALLGGSSMEIALECSGSIFYQLTNTFEEKENPEADKGTLTHEVGEKLLRDLLSQKAYGFAHGFYETPDCDPETLANAKAWREIVWKNGLQETITSKAWGIEDKFTLDEKLQMWGYTDFWAAHIDDRAKRCLVIGDYKNGYYVKEAKNNPQLAFYAAAGRAEFRRLGRDIDYARCFIYQPRAPGNEPYKEAIFTAKQLDKWEAKFYKVAEQIFVTKKPKFKVGEHCRFCKAKGICKTFAAHSSKALQLQLADTTSHVMPAPETLSLEQTAKIILNADLIEGFIKAVKAHAISQMKAGKKIPGLKLVPGVAKRKWLENEGFIYQGLTQAGLTDEQIFRDDLRGIGEIEKTVQELMKMSKKEAYAFLESYTEKPEANPVLTGEGDAREALPNHSALLKEVA